MKARTKGPDMGIDGKHQELGHIYLSCPLPLCHLSLRAAAKQRLAIPLWMFCNWSNLMISSSPPRPPSPLVNPQLQLPDMSVSPLADTTEEGSKAWNPPQGEAFSLLG
jgi:hypothetical protein